MDEEIQQAFASVFGNKREGVVFVSSQFSGSLKEQGGSCQVSVVVGVGNQRVIGWGSNPNLIEAHRIAFNDVIRGIEEGANGSCPSMP